MFDFIRNYQTYFWEIFLALKKGPKDENTPFLLARLCLGIMPRTFAALRTKLT